MCGIAGFALTRRDKVDGRVLSKALLAGIVVRGRDATGIAYHSRDDRQTILHKQDISAHQFIPQYLPKVPQSTRLAIMHTRAATKGSPKNNLNNHPIAQGPLVGVHNGWLVNDDDLFAEMPDVVRHGQVDSEAIFAMLAHSGQTPMDCLGKVWGRAALAWLDARDPGSLYLARAEGSPLAVGQTKHGGIVFASTMEILNRACKEVGITLVFRTEMPEMTYGVIKGGRIAVWENIKSHEYRISDQYAWAMDSRAGTGKFKSPGLLKNQGKSSAPKSGTSKSGPTVIGGKPAAKTGTGSKPAALPGGKTTSTTSTTTPATGTGSSGPHTLKSTIDNVMTRRPEMTAGRHSTPAPQTSVTAIPKSGESGKPDPTPTFQYGHQADRDNIDRWDAEWEAYQAEQATLYGEGSGS